MMRVTFTAERGALTAKLTEIEPLRDECANAAVEVGVHRRESPVSEPETVTEGLLLSRSLDVRLSQSSMMEMYKAPATSTQACAAQAIGSGGGSCGRSINANPHADSGVCGVASEYTDTLPPTVASLLPTPAVQLSVVLKRIETPSHGEALAHRADVSTVDLARMSVAAPLPATTDPPGRVDDTALSQTVMTAPRKATESLVEATPAAAIVTGCDAAASLMMLETLLL